MPQYSIWRSVVTTLPRSKRWRQATDSEARLWLGLLLVSDLHGRTEADPDQLRLLAVPDLPDWTEAKVEAALQGLAGCGLVQLYEAEGKRWLQLVDFDEHQPREAIRKRGKSSCPEPPNVGRPTPALRRPLEEEEEGEQPLGTDVPCATAEAAGTERKPPVPPQWPAQALEVYEHWKEQQRATGGLVPRKLTDDRRRKIVARLKDGYTVQQLCTAIDAFLADPWHLGKNNRDTRYTDLTTLFKNAAKVDAGLQLAARTKVSSSTTDEARSKYVRPVVPA